MFHRLACAIEDAGWEIRDTLGWIYGSGFPKSLNLGNGFGTALKPAWEPIILARKPISEKNITANVLKYGTGGLNIDGCRIKQGKQPGFISSGGFNSGGNSNCYGDSKGVTDSDYTQGRFPANLIHDGSGEVLNLFPETKSGKLEPWHAPKRIKNGNVYGNYSGLKTPPPPYGGDSGSAARFFYCAKASKHDRDEGLEGFEETKMGFSNGARIHGEGYDQGQGLGLNRVISRKNTHPTVKPIALMQYLCRLITPPDGIILDPFMGSGSTGKAAVKEGFSFIGIELNPDYIEIARKRIEAAIPKQTRMAL